MAEGHGQGPRSGVCNVGDLRLRSLCLATHVPDLKNLQPSPSHPQLGSGLFMVELANRAGRLFPPVLNDYHHPGNHNEYHVAMPDSPTPPPLGHIRKRTVRANGLDFPILEAGSGPSFYACTGFPIIHEAGPTSWIGSRGRDIGPSRRRCEGIGPVAPHPTDPTAPWRPGRMYSH